MFEIKLKSGFTGERYGLLFINGRAETNDGYLAGRLESKGIPVRTVIESEAEDNVPEDVPSAPEEENIVDNPKCKRGKGK